MAAHDEPPVWMEIWQPRGGYVMVPATDRDGFFGEKGPALAATWRDERRAQLAAAAPACVRALLAVEWATHGLEGHRQCPDCGGYQPDLTQPDRLYYFNRMDHRRDSTHYTCPLDAALTQAGLPTQVERDDIRCLLRAQRETHAAAHHK